MLEGAVFGRKAYNFFKSSSFRNNIVPTRNPTRNTSEKEN
jgi:hypothetical protein